MSLDKRKGTKGTLYTAKTNAFSLNWAFGKGEVHHYDDITPNWEVKIKSDGEAFKVGASRGNEIVMRIQTNEPGTFQPQGAFDGKKNLYSTARWFEARTFTVNWDSKPNPKRPPKQANVKITFVRSVNAGTLRNLVTGKLNKKSFALDTDAAMTLNMLNVFISATPKMKEPKIYTSKSIYTPVNKRDPPRIKPLELWRGFFQSVRPSLNNVIVNLDITVGVVLPAGRLDNVCMELLRLRDLRELSRLDDSRFATVRNFLRKTVRVSIALPGYDTKGARLIADVVKDVGQHVFINREGREVSVAEYFHETHNIRIVPGGLGVKIGKDSLFPISVCQVITQLYRSRPSPDVIRESLSFVPKDPAAHLDAIITGWKQLEYHNSAFLGGANITISEKPEPVNGRLLNSPEIYYNNGNGVLRNSKRPGVWDVMNITLQQPAKIASWVIITVAPNCPPHAAEALAIELRVTMQKLGMNVPSPLAFLPGSLHNIDRILSDALADYNAEFYLVILPNPAEETYVNVKRWGDITSGHVTQCVRWSQNLAENIGNSRRLNQYCNNLNLKINAKLGGTNTFPMTGVMKKLASNPAMILGADVSHPGPGSFLPSVAALVGSVDRQFCRYISTVRVQPPRVEIILEMKDMMKELLLGFQQLNKGVLPRHLVMLRDGVSEGEFGIVETHEIDGSMLEALKETYTDGKLPMLLFIVVGKRHRFRFFPNRGGEDPQGNGNVPSGFVLDNDTIIHPVYHDFYLQSQAGLKGTSRPSHYTVIRDMFNMTADELEELMYTLCHCYAISTRSVKVPAPVYYADRVCARSKIHFDADVYDNLSLSSNEDPESKMNFFRNRFRAVHVNTKHRMYFV